jgi:hypothetical protein
VRRLPRAETVLPLVILLGAIVLAASEFMVAFEFTPPGGEVQMEQTVADRHSYAMLVLAIFAVVALGVAIATASRPAAFAVAVIGGIALLMFLILDLPDAGKIGPLEDFITAKAEPQIGFWLQALGSVALGLGGAAFATLTPEQLESIRTRFRGTRGNSGSSETTRPAAPAAPAARTQATPAPAAPPAAAKPRPAAGEPGRRTAVPFDGSRDGSGESAGRERRPRRRRFRPTPRPPRSR